MSKNEALTKILKAKTQLGANDLFEFGVKIGKLYTDHGLPIDMALEELEMTKEKKTSVLDGSLWWLVEHRRQSGATEKAIERQRKANREAMRAFLDTGETGIY